MKKLFVYEKRKIFKGILIIVCAVLFFAGEGSTSFADATGKVTAPSAKIRKSADINSEVIGSSSQGKTITITAEVTDASGTLWYEVYVDSNTKGYIRSDLVSKDASSGDVPSTTVGSAASSTSTPAPEPTASGAELPAETPMDAQYAAVKVPAAKVRGGASTSKGIVDTIPQNTQVTVSGKTEGSDGKTWYYITFTRTNGQEATGYVRNDLIELGDMVPAPEPEETPGEEPAVSDEPEEILENKDYEAVYEMDGDGGVWYLYNNMENTKQKIDELLEAAHAQEDNEGVDAKIMTRQRIAIIVLIAIIIVCAFVMTLMFFKLRDAYYEAYEEDEEDDAITRGKERENVETKRSPVRGQGSPSREPKQTAVRRKPDEYEKRMPAGEVTYEESPETPVKTAPKKKAKNFMIDDEDFEFEFLNMKNKDIDK